MVNDVVTDVLLLLFISIIVKYYALQKKIQRRVTLKLESNLNNSIKLVNSLIVSAACCDCFSSGKDMIGLR